MVFFLAQQERFELSVRFWRLTVTRFPVVLVMTASILLRIGALDSKNDYTKNHSKVKHKFEKCAIF